MSTIALKTGSVALVVGDGILPKVAQYLGNATSIVIVTDQNVAPVYGRRLAGYLNCQPTTVHEWVLPPGELTKSFWQAECLYDFLCSKQVDRRGLILALGGGVVSDLAGFVAGTWQRGIPWVNCPTTLLAAVDAAIGGKTGLNHAGRKNCIGVFHQPVAVLIDTSTLSTLDSRTFSCGMAESIKHGVIADTAFFDWQTANAEGIRTRQPQILEQLIVRNIQIKDAIVQRDERDASGERAQLNFGHTIGHALEAASGFALPHGECVALGMMGALYIAQAKAMVDVGVVERVRGALEAFSLPTRLDDPCDADIILRILSADKKAVAGTARFVLPTRIGEVTAGHCVEDDQIRRALERLRK